MCKKQKRCLEMESLPHHVVERIMERLPTKTLLKYKCVSKQWKATLESRFFQEKHVQELIMERLPVKSLMRFKTVSKRWKSTIESPLFQERQLAHRQQSGDPDVLLVSAKLTEGSDTKVLATLTLVTKEVPLLSSSAVEIPTPWTNRNYFACYGSIDGLVCLYNPLTTDSGFVVNPTTRWFHPIPPSRLQQLIIDLGKEAYMELGHPFFKLGFGKDIVRGTYKPVWLYNSSEIGLENATTCEVFDFTTKAWRYVTPSSPYRVIGFPDPVFAYGSLHWFTDCEETKIVSFDFHTEAFQVLCKAPFAKAADPADIVMCNLNNRLCVSLRESRDQVIWSFHSGNKTWEKTWSINLNSSRFFLDMPKECAFSPLAFLDADEKEKMRLLFFYRRNKCVLLTQDLKLKLFHPAFLTEYLGSPVCYFPSLISF